MLLKSQELTRSENAGQEAASPVGMLRRGYLQPRLHSAAFDAVGPLLRIYAPKRPLEKKSL